MIPKGRQDPTRAFYGKNWDPSVRYFKLAATGMFIVLQAVSPRTSAQTRGLCDAFSGIRAYRESKLKPVDVRVMTVHTKSFTVLGLLGESTSQVYLATAPNGRHVAIKKMKVPTPKDGFEDEMIQETLSTLYLENARIEYYRSHRYATPKILGMQLLMDEIIVVKAYLEGITYRELRQDGAQILNSSLQYDLLNEVEVGLTELKELATHPIDGFWPWLQQHRFDYETKYPAMAEIRKRIDAYSTAAITEDYSTNAAVMELRPGNMLLRRSGRWILFDP